MSGDLALPFESITSAPMLSLLHLTKAPYPRLGSHFRNATSSAKPSQTVLYLLSPRQALKRFSAVSGRSQPKQDTGIPLILNTPPMPKGQASVTTSASSLGSITLSFLISGAGSPFTKAAIHLNAGFTLLVCTSLPEWRALPHPSLAVQALPIELPRSLIGKAVDEE